MLSGMTMRIGAYCWLAASLVLLAAHLVVQFAWERPYSWAAHNISDLGNVTCGSWGGDQSRYVCSPLHAWMNAAFIAFGLLLAAGVLLLDERRRTARVLFLLAAGGWVLVGLFPADADENLHVLGALLIFFFGNLGLLVAARRDRHLPTLAAGVLGLTAMVLHLTGHYLGLGMGGMERVAAFALPVWTIGAALAVLGRNRSARVVSPVSHLAR